MGNKVCGVVVKTMNPEIFSNDKPHTKPSTQRTNGTGREDYGGSSAYSTSIILTLTFLMEALCFTKDSM